MAADPASVGWSGREDLVSALQFASASDPANSLPVTLWATFSSPGVGVRWLQILSRSIRMCFGRGERI